jgi:hypothetical protein
MSVLLPFTGIRSAMTWSVYQQERTSALQLVVERQHRIKKARASTVNKDDRREIRFTPGSFDENAVKSIPADIGQDWLSSEVARSSRSEARRTPDQQ